MKKIVRFINEANNKTLYKEVQNEITPEAAYHTFDIQGIKDYDNCFLAYNEDSDSFSIIAFNIIDELEDMLGMENGHYLKLEDLEDIGDCIDIDGEKFMKIK